MAFSMSLEEYVDKKQSVFKNMDKFSEHVPTTVLKWYKATNTMDKDGDDADEIQHFVKLEYAPEKTLRKMVWNETKEQGTGYFVKKECYIITYEVVNPNHSVCATKYYIYEPKDAAEAFEMVSTICKMIKA